MDEKTQDNMNQITQASTLEDIANAISDTEKQLQASIKARAVIIERMYDINIKIINIDIDKKNIEKVKKDVGLSLSKGRDNVKLLESDLRQLRSLFFSKKSE